MFLDYWYPRKVSCTSESSLRGIAASLKKFYAFMKTESLVSEEAVAYLQEQIRSSMPEWLEQIRRRQKRSH
jgi:site-specific recombinase XerD